MNALDLQGLPAQYGTLSRYERFNNPQFQRLMEITLEEIRSGKFAQEWAKEFGADYPRLRQLLKKPQKYGYVGTGAANARNAATPRSADE